jgi:molybdenum cofactor synthesis domain-containing protein
MSLEVDISKTVGDIKLSKKFKLEEEIMIFYGPSGSGKTTILNCISGLNTPDEGEVKLNGKTIYSAKKRIDIPPFKRKIGYIFQDYALFPHLNVYENILYSKKDDILDKSKINKIMDKCHIRDLKSRYPSKLSGGEKQRVALARALMIEPELLLLDEPLSSIDNELKNKLMNEIKLIQREWKIPFIYVTHSKREFKFLGDRFISFDSTEEVNFNEYKKISVENSAGNVIAHDMTQIIPDEYKGARFKKGDIIKEEDIEILKDMGKESIYILELDDNTLHEDEAALIMSNKIKNDNLALSEPHEGKISLIAEKAGILKLDKELLFEVNSEDDILITAAQNNIPVKTDEIVAGIRINPLTIEKKKIENVEEILNKRELFELIPYQNFKVGIVITGNEVYEGRIDDKFLPTLKRKFNRWGGSLLDYEYVPDDPEKITESLISLKNKGADILITGGGMSVDPDDVTPLGIKNTGAEVVKHGVPVLPGNKLLVAYLDDVPILGLPACVIFEEITVFDIIYPRVLTGENITRDDLVNLSYGGLCHHCPVCQYPHCSFGKVD